jgi:hypothetical protein
MPLQIFNQMFCHFFSGRRNAKDNQEILRYAFWHWGSASREILFFHSTLLPSKHSKTFAKGKAINSN